jgi:hypothetical protein
MRLVVSLRPEHAAANAHAFEIDDRLGENRKPRRLRIVRPGLDPATESAVPWIKAADQKRRERHRIWRVAVLTQSNQECRSRNGARFGAGRAASELGPDQGYRYVR